MEALVVTSTREARDKSKLAESVSVINECILNFIGPAHPAEALNRAAGIHINNLAMKGIYPRLDNQACPKANEADVNVEVDRPAGLAPRTGPSPDYTNGTT